MRHRVSLFIVACFFVMGPVGCGQYVASRTSTPGVMPLAAESSFPIGTIVAYLGDAAAVGPSWLPCDGRSLAIEEYQPLFERLGWQYGRGSDARALAYFSLPDLRGLFLRGTDGGAGTDPGRENRSLRSDGTLIVGDRVGTFEGYATALPNHRFATDPSRGEHSHASGEFDRMMRHTGNDTVKEGTDSRDDGSEVALHTSAGMSAGLHGHEIDRGGDEETRPRNFSVHWLIRVR
jgi:hypothetical protein